MDLQLNAKTALITGGSKGIGAAVAVALAREGCNLRLAARDQAALDNLCGALQADHGVKAEAFAVDLRDTDALNALAEANADIDILINNAGDIPAMTLDQSDDVGWRHAWELKVYGYINLSRAIYRSMRQRGGGVIVNNIGTAGERPSAGYIVGSSGNAALMAFTRALGGASLDDNIRVVAVNPGPVETDRLRNAFKAIAQSKLGDRERYRELLASYPQSRAASPEEVADVIAFVASPRCAYVSGAIITVDGGLSARG